MEIVPSWSEKAAQKTREEIALNLLSEGMATEVIVRLTGLTVERVIQLQAIGNNLKESEYCQYVFE